MPATPAQPYGPHFTTAPRTPVPRGRRPFPDRGRWPPPPRPSPPQLPASSPALAPSSPPSFSDSPSSPPQLRPAAPPLDADITQIPTFRPDTYVVMCHHFWHKECHHLWHMTARYLRSNVGIWPERRYLRRGRRPSLADPLPSPSPGPPAPALVPSARPDPASGAPPQLKRRPVDRKMWLTTSFCPLDVYLRALSVQRWFPGRRTDPSSLPRHRRPTCAVGR